MNARQSFASIYFNNVNITQDISPYLLSVSYTDCEEGETDDLQIKLQDKRGDWLYSWLDEMFKGKNESSTGSQYKVNSQTGLRMYSRKGPDGELLCTLSYGTVVSVSDDDGTWASVTSNGVNGYVMNQYLEPYASSTQSTVDVSSLPMLSFGSQGEYVKTMQQLLVNKGQSLPKYGVDGYFGSETRAAVMAFQTAVSIAVDGICGPVTWAALYGATSSSESGGYKDALKISASLHRENWNDGYADDLDCGEFELDSIDASFPPSEITLKATSLTYTSPVRKTKKSKSWENISLYGIASEIASSNGLAFNAYVVPEGFYNPTYSHIEQNSESDIEFLTRLARLGDLGVKVTSNMICLIGGDYYATLPTVCTFDSTGAIGSCKSYKLYTSEADSDYDSCRVRYVAPDGSCIEGIAKKADYDETSKSNQQLEINARVLSVAEAITLAERQLRLHNKFNKVASFTLPGNPSMCAGLTVRLACFGPWSGLYVINTAKHSISSSGYTTTIDLRRVSD